MTEINNASHRKTNSTFHFLSCGYFHFPFSVYFHFSPVRIITFTFHLLNVFTFSLFNAFIFHLGIFSLSLSWMLSLSLFLCDTWFWESHCLLSLGNWGTGGVQKNRTRCQGLAACSNIMRRYKCLANVLSPTMLRHGNVLRMKCLKGVFLALAWNVTLLKCNEEL